MPVLSTVMHHMIPPDCISFHPKRASKSGLRLKRWQSRPNLYEIMHGPSKRFWNFSATGHLLWLGSGDLDASRFAHSGRTEGQRREVCSPGSQGTGCWWEVVIGYM